MSDIDLEEVLKEVKRVRRKVERLENLVEERLVGSEPPSEDEMKAIAEYEAAKKKKTVELVPLRKTARGT